MIVMAADSIISSIMSFGAPPMAVLTSTGSIAETPAVTGEAPISVKSPEASSGRSSLVLRASVNVAAPSPRTQNYWAFSALAST